METTTTPLAASPSARAGLFGAIAVIPGAAVDIEQGGKTGRGLWTIDHGEPGLLAVTAVFDILDLEPRSAVWDHSSELHAPCVCLLYAACARALAAAVERMPGGQQAARNHPRRWVCGVSPCTPSFGAMMK